MTTWSADVEGFFAPSLPLPALDNRFLPAKEKVMHKVILVDLDGTLAHYTGWKGRHHIGAPIPAMAQRVRTWLRDGHEVRIFTARVDPRRSEEDLAETTSYIVDWCRLHFGIVMPVTCVKGYDASEIWDDRARQVEMNTGRVAEFETVDMAEAFK